MFRRCICLMGTVCVAMGIGLSAAAAEPEGEIRIRQLWAGEEIVGGAVSVCRVGEQTPDGFTLTDGLANWAVSEQDIHMENWEFRGVLPGSREYSGGIAEGLEPGLYLVAQTEAPEGFLKFKPFLQSIPQAGQWRVLREVSLIRDAEIPATGDHHAPIVAAMGIGLSVAVLMVLADQRKK